MLTRYYLLGDLLCNYSTTTIVCITNRQFRLIKMYSRRVQLLQMKRDSVWDFNVRDLADCILTGDFQSEEF